MIDVDILFDLAERLDPSEVMNLLKLYARTDKSDTLRGERKVSAKRLRPFLGVKGVVFQQRTREKLQNGYEGSVPLHLTFKFGRDSLGKPKIAVPLAKNFFLAQQLGTTDMNRVAALLIIGTFAVDGYDIHSGLLYEDLEDNIIDIFDKETIKEALKTLKELNVLEEEGDYFYPKARFRINPVNVFGFGKSFSPTPKLNKHVDAEINLTKELVDAWVKADPSRKTFKHPKAWLVKQIKEGDLEVVDELKAIMKHPCDGLEDMVFKGTAEQGQKLSGGFEL